MGNATGKLIVNRHDGKTKTEATVEPAKLNVGKQNASQLVNGEPGCINDVPSIDEVVDESSARNHVLSSSPQKSAEISPHGDQPTDGPNGNLNVSGAASEDNTGSQKKKSKKYVDWLKHRLSFADRNKRSFSKGKNADTQQNVPATTDATVPEDNTPAENVITKAAELPPSPEVTETAACLVEEAICSAVAETIRETAQEPTLEQEIMESIPATEEKTESLEPKHEDIVVEESHEDVVPEEPVSASPPPFTEQLVPEDEHELPKESYTEEQHETDDFPVLDTNNTNVTTEEHDTTEGDLPSNHPSPAFDEEMSSKLLNLELTNGHSETTHADESYLKDVVVNGE